MQSTLRVRLVRGENLPAADSNGLSDPYVVLRLDGEQKKKSETIYKTLNPDWSQDFFFDETLGDVGKALSLEVWDRDTLSSDFLGKGEYDVSSLQQGVKTEVSIDLMHPSKSGPRGTVFLVLYRTVDDKQAMNAQEREAEIKATSGLGLGSMLKAVGGQVTKAISRATQTHPQGGKGVKRMVTIDVVKARGIPPMDTNGYADPYCRVKAGRKRRTTRTQFRTLFPEWRERFVFILFDMGGRDSNMCKVDIWDKDTIGSDDKVGSVDIDLSGLPLNLTDERWWKLKRPESKGLFGFGGSAKPTEPPTPDPEVLLLITVADLFEPQLPADQLAAAQKASQGWLRVHVLKADNLPPMDSNGLADPFVVIEVGNRHMRTATIDKELNPEWNSVLEMPVKDIFECVYVHVYDEDNNGKFELIGSLCLPLLSLKNGVATWYQLKDKSLQQATQGCVKLAFHLNYLKAPMLAKCISRRAHKHMETPEAFKFKVLKANIARLQVFLEFGLQAALWGKAAMTWEISEPITVGFLIGWILFWHFVQPWHLSFGLFLGILFLGMQKFRGKLFNGRAYDADAYVEEEVAEESVVEGGEEDDEEDGEGGGKGMSIPNPLALRSQMRQMRTMARTVQNLLGDIASYVERVNNLFNWESPVLTALCALGCLIATFLMIFMSLRYFIMLWGINKVARTGLRKYHPAFKRPMYYKPIVEVVEFIGRVPDNLEVEQRKVLPLPEHLQADSNVKIKTD